jgi:hypothetical protein
MLKQMIFFCFAYLNLKLQILFTQIVKTLTKNEQAYSKFDFCWRFLSAGHDFWFTVNGFDI